MPSDAALYYPMIPPSKSYPLTFERNSQSPVGPLECHRGPTSKHTSRRPDYLQPPRISGIRQPIPRRMEGNASRRRSRRHRKDDLARLHVRNFDPPVRPRSTIVTPAADIAPIKGEAHASDCTHTSGQGALAYPVRGVEQTDESVGTTGGEVACCWRKRKARSGRGVRVDGVGDLEGGKLAELDGAGAGGEENVVGRRVGGCMREDRLVRLCGLGEEGAEGIVGDGDGYERVILMNDEFHHIYS